MSVCTQNRWCIGIPKAPAVRCDIHQKYLEYTAPKCDDNTLPSPELCDTCDGFKECWHCEGSGMLEFECQCHHNCGETTEEICKTCDGDGECNDCHGTGTYDGDEITGDAVLNAISRLNEQLSRGQISSHTYSRKKATYDKLYSDVTKDLRLAQFDKWLGFTGTLHPLDIRNVEEASPKVHLDPKLYEALR